MSRLVLVDLYVSPVKGEMYLHQLRTTGSTFRRLTGKQFERYWVRLSAWAESSPHLALDCHPTRPRITLKRSHYRWEKAPND